MNPFSLLPQHFVCMQSRDHNSLFPKIWIVDAVDNLKFNVNESKHQQQEKIDSRGIDIYTCSTVLGEYDITCFATRSTLTLSTTTILSTQKQRYNRQRQPSQAVKHKRQPSTSSARLIKTIAMVAPRQYKLISKSLRKVNVPTQKVCQKVF